MWLLSSRLLFYHWYIPHLCYAIALCHTIQNPQLTTDLVSWSSLTLSSLFLHCCPAPLQHCKHHPHILPVAALPALAVGTPSCDSSTTSLYVPNSRHACPSFLTPSPMPHFHSLLAAPSCGARLSWAPMAGEGATSNEHSSNMLVPDVFSSGTNARNCTR